MIVKKPLYGIAEAGTHWWDTYNKHHRENLEMESSSYDPCLLISTKENETFGVVGMQTDDTIGLSDKGFDDRENEKLKDAKFAAKPKQYLTTDSPIIFNGGVVNLDQDGNIHLKQKGQCNKLQLVNADDCDKSRQRYAEQRARGAYIAINLTSLSVLDQVQTANDKGHKGANRAWDELTGSAQELRML